MQQLQQIHTSETIIARLNVLSEKISTLYDHVMSSQTNIESFRDSEIWAQVETSTIYRGLKLDIDDWNHTEDLDLAQPFTSWTSDYKLAYEFASPLNGQQMPLMLKAYSTLAIDIRSTFEDLKVELSMIDDLADDFIHMSEIVDFTQKYAHLNNLLLVMQKDIESENEFLVIETPMISIID